MIITNPPTIPPCTQTLKTLLAVFRFIVFETFEDKGRFANAPSATDYRKNSVFLRQQFAVIQKFNLVFSVVKLHSNNYFNLH